MVTITECLRIMPCLRDFSDQELSIIAEICDSICYSPGHILFTQSERAKHLYLLKQGKVDIFQEEEGKEPKRVDRISVGEIVGGSALVPPYLYNASAKCQTEIEVLEINIGKLQELIKKDKALGLKIQACFIGLLVKHISKLRTQ
jgi:CRP/FNR family transcriptional regulator, cyclic AMP receptor protein